MWCPCRYSFPSDLSPVVLLSISGKRLFNPVGTNHIYTPEQQWFLWHHLSPHGTRKEQPCLRNLSTSGESLDIYGDSYARKSHNFRPLVYTAIITACIMWSSDLIDSLQLCLLYLLSATHPLEAHAAFCIPEWFFMVLQWQIRCSFRLVLNRYKLLCPSLVSSGIDVVVNGSFTVLPVMIKMIQRSSMTLISCRRLRHCLAEGKGNREPEASVWRTTTGI